MRPAISGFWLLIVAATSPLAAMGQQVTYTISFPNAAHHEAEIEVIFTEVQGNEPLQARMSRTSPGRYALHEFAKNVYSVRAFDGRDLPLNVTRPNPHQWDVAGHDGTVRMTYTLFGDRTDGTYTGIDSTHAHLNMPATFIWARGLEDAPIRIAFDNAYPEWKIATQLFPTDDATVFTAPDLAYFLDSPTELSAHTIRTWQVPSGDAVHTLRLAVHHNGTENDVDVLAAMARSVVAEQVAVFGETPAFETGEYTFIADYLPWVFSDGMEHRNSTILTSRNPLAGNGAQTNLGTLSHEFFHAWSVERIRPRSLEPFDLEETNMSDALWFAEGFTSYYSPLVIRRAGIMGDREYASRISSVLNTVINAPGRQFYSPVEMSMRAPFVDAAVYNDPQNTENTFVSYYTWGAAIGLGLDLALRTQYGLTLDDYMRTMWVEYGRVERPYTLADLESVLGDVTRDAAFARDFFDRYIEGSEAMDYASLLAAAGFLLRKANPGAVWLGANVIEQGGRTVVSASPLIGSPLYTAEIASGASILTVDGNPLANAQDFRELIARANPGDRHTIAYAFRGEQREVPLILTEDPTLEVVTYEAAGIPLTQTARMLRESWLESKQ